MLNNYTSYSNNIIEIPEKKREQKTSLKSEFSTENSSKLMSDTQPQIQEAQRPRRREAKKIKHRRIIFKLRKSNIFKSAKRNQREKTTLFIEEQIITANFSETMQGKENGLKY